ncbi:MAG: alpha/beta fold hydrolase [Chloroflexi bacterium]|nr:alpha/beta fold hydrolase [Chloroflexota bacterium]MCC6897067.1 alpha/beta fold hydrolase [Anaerolineae bacterium]
MTGFSPPQKRGRRYWQRLLIFFVGLILLIPCTLGFLATFGLAFNYVMPFRGTVVRPSDLPPTTQDVNFIGADDLTLRGWYIPPQNGTVVILLHGYYNDRTEMLFHALHLAGAGYGALLYDQRAAGESDGSQRSLGWRDVEDVGGAIAFLSGKADTLAIAGCSIGGQVALRAAARYPELAAVFADGPAAVSAADLPPADGLEGQLTIGYHSFVDRLVALQVGMSIPPSLMDTVSQIASRPILLFAGEFGSERFYVRRFQQAAGANAEYWEIPGATHCNGPYTAPAEYANRMLQFFDNRIQSHTP